MDQIRSEQNTQIVVFGSAMLFSRPPPELAGDRKLRLISQMLASWLLAGAGLAPGLGLGLATTSSIVKRDWERGGV